MTKIIKRNKNKQNEKKKNGNGARAPQPNGRLKGPPANVMHGNYAEMLSDPCNSKLVPGFYGSVEGYLARFHKVLSPSDVAANNCGVLLWIPDYHCVGPDGTFNSKYNCISLAGTASNATLNIDGYGAGSTAVADPAYSFVAGTTAADARTISACIKMSYTGQMATTQGMVGSVDIAFSAFEDRLRGGVLSVDSLFELSQMVQRTSLDPLEVKWTPQDASSKFRGPGDGLRTETDIPITVISGAYTVGQAAAVDSPRVIGFVYKGFESTRPLSTVLQFDLYKNIEWRPQSTSGLSMPVPVRTSIVPPVNTALALLDSTVPDWRHKTKEMAQSGASKIAKKALAYSGQMVLKKVPALAGFLL